MRTNIIASLYLFFASIFIPAIGLADTSIKCPDFKLALKQAEGIGENAQVPGLPPTYVEWTLVTSLSGSSWSSAQVILINGMASIICYAGSKNTPIGPATPAIEGEIPYSGFKTCKVNGVTVPNRWLTIPYDAELVCTQ